MSLSQDVLAQLKQQLETKKSELQLRKQRLAEEDPFNGPDRQVDNAAVDADAAEQFGHETAQAMREEVDRKLAEVEQALERVEAGNYGVCKGCQQEIGQGRLKIDPAAAFCVSCQQKKTVVDVG